VNKIPPIYLKCQIRFHERYRAGGRRERRGRRLTDGEEESDGKAALSE